MPDIITEIARVKKQADDLGLVLKHVQQNPSIDNLKALVDKYRSLKEYLDQLILKL